MRRLAVTLLAGMLAGVVLLLAGQRLGIVGQGPATHPVRDIVDVAPMGSAEATRHRDNHFMELQTIESLQALPSEFDRGEALYALSGRSDSAGLQKLAFDAGRIADPVWRERALSIVFFRMTEMDPKSALVMARSDNFQGTRNIEKRVWRTWARMDLMAAIEAVRALDDDQEYAAAQMIYSGVGGAYTADAMLVESELGVPPSRSNRAIYLRDLVDQSPEKALSHVLVLESEKHRFEQIEWIALALANEDLAGAETFADSIDDVDLRRRYLNEVYDRIARVHPEEAFEKRFVNRGSGALSDREKAGFKKLVDTDLDRALRLMGAISDDANRAEMAKIVAIQYAKESPTLALEWARTESQSEFGSLVREVIASFATTDPELALTEAQRIEDGRDRSKLTLEIINAVLELSPEKAARSVDYIKNQSDRQRAAQTVARKWLEEDAIAAVDWLLGSDPEIQEEVFSMGYIVAKLDLDDAHVVVTSLPAKYRGAWANGVAKRLASERSAEEAMQFVSQFAGEPGFDMQMAQLVSSIASEDSALAARWAERIPQGHARDAALSNVVAAEARRDPASAIQRLQQINDTDLRQVAAGDIVRRWYRSEPEAASQWLDTLPRGADRDNIILNTAMQMSQSRDEQLRLIASIDDSEKRQQAMFMRVMLESKDDPEEMVRQLESMDMPDIFRQQIKAQILRGAARGY